MISQRSRKVLFATGATLCGFAFAPASSAATQQADTTRNLPRSSQAQDASSSPSPLYADDIKEALRLYRAGKTEEAEKSYREIVQKSTGKDAPSEAEAHLGLASVETRHANFDEGRKECQQALALFKSLNNARGIARTQDQLGNIALTVGDSKAARSYFSEALQYYDAARLLQDKAGTLLTLANATEGYGERIKMDNQALEIARQIGDRRTQGRAHHDIGQWVFIQGDSEAAQEHYKEAEALLDAPEDKIYLARVLLSEGRLQRAHGEMDRSIEIFNRAVKMAEEVGDKQGQLQLLNALGSSYGDSGRHREALNVFQRAYELAKNTGSARVLNSLRRNIAEVYIYMGEYQRGAEIVDELNRQTPDPFPYDAQYRYATLGLAYKGMGKYEDALAATKKSVEEAKAHKNGQFLSEPLMLKAHIEEKLGDSVAALADVREALKDIEELRAHLVPSDFMKRGFADKTQQAFDYSVELLEGMNQPEKAIEVAEEARSRAFLDLLASHQLALRQGAETNSAAVASRPASQQSEAEAKSRAQSGTSRAGEQLTTRGGKAAPTPNAIVSDTAEPELPSVASAESASLKDMQEQARRLRSTILSYWVGDESAFVWVLDAEGSIHSSRIAVKREHLVELVRGVWPQKRNPEPTAKSASAGEKSRAEDQSRGGEVEFPTRGQEDLQAERSQKDRWRELYGLLIEPIEADLPKDGSRITIIPHGPLFSLAFAGLRDAKNRYFLERYPLEYAPAISMLKFTSGNRPQTQNAPSHFLMVADPSGMQKLGLPQLPGSRAEVSTIARRLPRDEVTVLVGAQAQRENVRATAAKSSVIHFATHGIVNDTQPFDSFLALSDGKLTARDIYGLSLQADLVFLSACRSGMGKVTGDGVLGLTRAFLYAGTRSVVATLWDVADEPTATLVARFYKNLSQGEDKAQALRSAQLAVLGQLRAGRIQVHTPRGPITLPENPVFWASFVLIGEP